MRLKTSIVQVRLTDGEKETLKALAAKKQMSQSEYFRWFLARESASL
jgi:hypothetical protein